MKEKNKLQSVVAITYIVVFLLTFAFAIYMRYAERSSVYQARAIEQCEILEDYTETTVEDSSAPVGIRKEYRFKLSNISTTKDYLAFYIVHHYAEVNIDGELVYSLTAGENNKIGSSPSSNWVFIPLYNTDNGKDVQIAVTPVYKSVVDRKIEFMLGSRSDILLKRLKIDAPQLILSVLCIFIGIALMIILPIAILRKKSNSWGLFYLGNLLFLIGVWRITDTRFSPIFFSKNPMSLGYISMAALFIAFAPALLFIKDSFIGRKKTLLLITTLAACINALIALICQVSGTAELRETLILCHIMLFVCLAVMILVSVTRIDKKTGEARLHRMVLLLSAGALADLIYFYSEKTSSGVIFTVTALLIYIAVRAITEMFNINRKIYIDAQTGLFNRSRWNALMDNSAPISEATGVMMLDLNRLKYINDTMGHMMGDKMIIDFADILSRTLPDDCMIFRWGGDEFTVLVSDADRDKIKDYISQISAATEAHNLSGEKPEIHFAVGYALSVDYPTLSREELLRKADEKMYHNKSEWYHKNVPDYHLI